MTPDPATQSPPPLPASNWLLEPSPAWLRSLVCLVLLGAAAQTYGALRPHTDLYPTYLAASLANDGEWGEIYHGSAYVPPGTSAAWDGKAADLGIDTAQRTGFTAHPYYLTAVRPVAALWEYRGFQRGAVWAHRAVVVWLALSLTALMGYRSLGVQLLLTLLTGFASPFSGSALLGQNTPLALALALGAALAWADRGRPPWQGGLLCALTVCVKPWCVLLLGVVFLVRRPVEALLTALSVLAALLLLPWLVLPAPLVRGYFDLLAHLPGMTLSGWNNLSVIGAVQRLQQPDWATGLFSWISRPTQPWEQLVAGTVAVLVAAAALWLVLRRRPSRRWTALASLSLMLVPLSVCWAHYFAFAWPLACVAAAGRHESRALRMAGGLLVLLLTGLRPWAFNLARSVSEHPADAAWAGWTLAPLCAVVAAALLALWRSPRIVRGAP